MEARRISIVETYKTYIKKYPKGTVHYLTFGEYIKVMKAIGEELAYFLITTGKRVNMPHKLGWFQAVKYYKREVDFPGKWEKKHKFNRRRVVTQGFRTTIHWSIYHNLLFKNKSRYVFNVSRPNLRVTKNNKTKPRVCLYQFFREMGYRLYEIKRF